MFNIGAGEMILIALVLLIAVGPEQLPGLIRRAGRTVSQFRSLSDGLRRDFMSSMDELERASDPRKWADDDVDRHVRSPGADRASAAAAAGDTETDDPSDDDAGQDGTSGGEAKGQRGAQIGKIAVPPPFSSSSDLEAMMSSSRASATTDGNDSTTDADDDNGDGMPGGNGATPHPESGDATATTADTAADTSDPIDGGDGGRQPRITTDSSYDALIDEPPEPEAAPVDDDGRGVVS